jgi:hypothetical protein
VELTPELNSGQALQGFINWFKQAKTISSLKAEFQFSDSLQSSKSTCGFSLKKVRISFSIRSKQRKTAPRRFLYLALHIMREFRTAIKEYQGYWKFKIVREWQV